MWSASLWWIRPSVRPFLVFRWEFQPQQEEEEDGEEDGEADQNNCDDKVCLDHVSDTSELLVCGWQPEVLRYGALGRFLELAEIEEIYRTLPMSGKSTD
jgi:hypothetical protein